MRVVCLGSYASAKEHAMTFNEAGTVLEKLLSNVQSLVPTPILPAHKRGKTSALYHLGASKWFQGITMRPELPGQQKVMDIFEKVLVGAGASLGDAPFIEDAAGPSGPLEHSLPERRRMANNGMYRIRDVRREQ